eukprot:Phypoly_transcript_09690.p1 GENE.Phypoly_transcript_09690~~Phypoly_transcript_09690.p1  ORF type:complete len:349 (+),score=45.67 Phypoly_transcript_09690:292-1338(+)
MPVTFDVDPTKEPTANNKPGPGSIAGHLYLELQNNGGKIIKATDVGKDKYISTRFINGFVGACITAYNGHYHLEIGPDEVWVTITSSLSRYITANAEKLRAVFVSHEGKMELNAVGGGNIYSADYSDLIGQLSEGIDKNTKGDIKDWIECSFSTTTPVSKIVSKVVLMAAMKEYFTYKMSLECGLPKVTLRGTVEDWKEIRARVNKLREFNDKTLGAWSQVLALVLDRFVSAFTEKHVSTNFWNRVAHIEGGGSGPRYLEGWILAFVGFNDRGHYILKDFDHIRSTNDFGRMNTNDVPTATVQVPVTIDDNGVVHKTIFYAGPMLATFHENTISTALDWALVDVTEKS